MRVRTEKADYWPLQNATASGTTPPVEEKAIHRDGVACAKCVGGSTGYLEMQPPIVTDRGQYFRIAFWTSSVAPGANEGILRLVDNTGTLAEVSLKTNGKFSGFNAVKSKNIGVESASAATVETWYIVEMFVSISSTLAAGSISWRVLNNDGSVFHAEQVATGEAAETRKIGVKLVRAGHTSTQAPTYLIDGFIMNDARGTANNSWVGASTPTVPVPASHGCYEGAIMDGDVGILEGTGARADAPYAGSGIETWNLFEAHQGRTVAFAGFSDPWTEGEGPVWDGFGAGASERCYLRRAIPYKTLGGPTNVIAQVNEGKYDAALTTYANAARAFGSPFFLRLWWEMNFTAVWAWNTATPEAFIEAWRRVYGIFQAAGATNATFVWCPNIIYGAEDPEAWYPGDAYVHWTGFDAYNGEHPNKKQGWRTPASLLTPTYERILEIAPGKPIFIGEIACSEYTTPTIHNTGEKAAWLAQLFPTLKTLPAIQAVSWFNWNIEHEAVRVDWPIESAAEGKSATLTREAYAAAIADPYFYGPQARGAFGSTVGTPTPAPTPASPTRLCPKLRIPFAMAGGELATVEQGTLDEVAQCVYAIVATPLGSRIDDMRFGLEDATFDTLPLDPTEMLSQVQAYEPAAQVAVAQEVEELSTRVAVEVETSR